MALVLSDRVQETSITTGTGTLTLAGAVAGFRSFATIGNGNTTYYTITNAAGAWEVGIGTYTSAGTTLSRTTVLSSSNAGSLVSFTGTLNVFVTYPAGKSVNEDEAGVVTGYPITVLDNAFTLQDNVDPTKQAQFQVSGVTTATTAVYNLPFAVANPVQLAALNVPLTFSSGQTFSAAGSNFGTFAGTTTYNFASGATTTGLTKTVNFGTGGLSGSTTAITMGATTGAGASTTTMYGTHYIGGAAGSESLRVVPTAGTGVNYLQIQGNTTTNSPIVSALGGDANIALAVRAKGTFNTAIQSDAGLNIHDFAPTATSVNWLRSTAAQTLNPPTLSAQGSDANINLRFTPKGTGVVTTAAAITLGSATATTVGGSATAYLQMGTTAGLGIYFGSGAPTIAAAQGSLYIRSDGSSTSTRMYINTNGSTTWTNVTTGA